MATEKEKERKHGQLLNKAVTNYNCGLTLIKYNESSSSE